MTQSEFEDFVAERKAKRPLWFELEREAPALSEDIDDLEGVLGVQLPIQYREFLNTHGAGMFAFLKVLGLKQGTNWDLRLHRRLVPIDFIPVADLETGDYYGHRVVDGRCDERVAVWDHETAEIQPTQYEDFYALVAALGLNG